MTTPGEVNLSEQQFLRLAFSADRADSKPVWIVKCQRCFGIYGRTSTGAWASRCPGCQKGEQGVAIPTERDGQSWTREEHVIAFQVYNRIPFGSIHMRNPEIIELAALLGRKVGSASRKLANFARLDPVHRDRGIRGLEHGSKGEEDVWREFSDTPEDLAYESVRLIGARLGQSAERFAGISESDLHEPGTEREALVKLRVNQSFFRQRVLSCYCCRCCITGLSCRPLLVASHIVSWAEDTANRLNPRNGLCLNALHDRAFDRKLIWIDSDFRVRLSSSFRKMLRVPNQATEWLIGFENRSLMLPEHFEPDRELLAKHASQCEE